MPSPSKPSRLLPLSDVDAAWLAGLMEGEGSFMSLTRHGGRNTAARISCGMCDRDVLERAASLVGVGTVRLVVHREGALGRKPHYQWCITRQSEIRELALRLRPWLGERRRAQVDAMIESVGPLNIQPDGYCMRGHELTPENRLPRKGLPVGPCRTCNAAARRQRYLRRRAESCTPQ